MTYLLVIVAAYLIGGIPFGYLLVRWKNGGDVREQGSGNIGATNVLRTSGAATGIATLVLDALKGWFAVHLAAHILGNDTLWLSAAAFAAIAGHIFTPFLKFKGGKGVATFVGAFLYLTPAALAAATVVFIGFVLYSHYVSLGSVVAAATFPLGVWLIQKPPLVVLLAAVLSSALVIYRHKANLGRLHAGTENRFRWPTRKG